MEALGLAYIVLGLIFGTSIGWLLSKGKVSSESTASEQELYRLRALIEAKEEVFEGTREQMLDAYKLAAGEAFSTAIELADKEKESSFKTATEKLSTSIGEYQKALLDLERGNNDMNVALRERLDSMVEAGIKISDDANNLTRALKGDLSLIHISEPTRPY